MSSNNPEYQAAYIRKQYRENKQYYLDKAAQQKRRATRFVWGYKQFLGCSRCDEDAPVCLDFHHVDSKKKKTNISNMIRLGASLLRILDEIAKCILLCANCHRKETFKGLVVQRIRTPHF